MSNDERAAQFKEVVTSLQRAPNIFVTQVDPDAVGSAFGLAHLLASMRPDLDKARITYCGAIGHPQNRALINKYNLRARMTHISDLPEGDEGPTALVDSSMGADSRMPQGLTLEPVIVIDHHRGTDLEEEEGKFLWIEDVGSACTLIAELMQAHELHLADAPVHLPVLLALGIYTDSKSLVAASERDRAAYAWVNETADQNEVQRMIHYPLPRSHFDNLAHALTHFQQRAARLVASAGYVNPEEGDDLSTIADYFLRMDGVSLVIVWGIVGDKVRVSARNTNLSTPLDEFLRARFGAASGAKLTPDGTGEGGARVRLDLGPWMSAGTEPEIEAMVSKRINEWIFSD